MDSQKIKDSLASLTVIFEKIDALEVRTAISLLLNIVESLVDENETYRKTIQELTDEINRLKGEQGKPKIRPQKNNGKGNHSSEEERKKRRKKDIRLLCWRVRSLFSKLCIKGCNHSAKLAVF